MLISVQHCECIICNLGRFLISLRLVYKIPYLRARAWPSSAFRPSASREQRYLAYNFASLAILLCLYIFIGIFVCCNILFFIAVKDNKI